MFNYNTVIDTALRKQETQIKKRTRARNTSNLPRESKNNKKHCCKRKRRRAFKMLPEQDFAPRAAAEAALGAGMGCSRAPRNLHGPVDRKTSEIPHRCARAPR